MRRVLSLLLTGCLAVLSLATGTLRAQSGLTPQEGPPSGPGPGFRPHRPGDFGPRGFGPIEGCLNSGRVVAGESYTGQVTYDQVEPVLNSATPIDRTTTEAILRDNEGRTQRQIALPPFGATAQDTPRQLICINDPVAGFGYVLDPAKMTARQFKLHQRNANAGATPSTQPPIPPNGGPRWGGRPDAHVTTTPLPASSAPAAISKECSAVQGTQITRTLTIPVANNQTTPIQIVTTRWYCPAFSMNLETQTTDPLHGITTRTVTITGAGPASIAVPSGYTVIPAGTGDHGRRAHPGPPPSSQQ